MPGKPPKRDRPKDLNWKVKPEDRKSDGLNDKDILDAAKAFDRGDEKERARLVEKAEREQKSRWS